MGNIVRNFQTSVRIVRPDYAKGGSEQEIVRFVSKRQAKDGESLDMLGYSFEESIADVDSDFTITLLPSVDGNGETWVDKILPMDLVFYEEFEKARFCGVVSSVRYMAQMGDSGPMRSVVVQGKGFGKLLSDFQLVMDYHLWLGGPDAETASKKLNLEIEAAGRKLKNILVAIYTNFMLLSTLPSSGAANVGIKAVLDHYIDMSSRISDSLEAWYTMAISLYQPGVNDIWTILKTVIPAPLYELFGRWNSDTQKFELVARLAPFDAEDWNNLECVQMNPDILTSYSVGRDNAEVRTFFFASSPWSVSREEALTVDYYKHSRKINEEKWPMYGYRPLEMMFRFIKRDPDTQQNIESVLEKAASTMYNWYGKNDELMSGQCEIISADDQTIMKYPSIGSKLSFLGGEWYIERTSHTWTYGKSPKTTLWITRGYVYDHGAMVGMIPSIGKRLKELEAKQ